MAIGTFRERQIQAQKEQQAKSEVPEVPEVSEISEIKTEQPVNEPKLVLRSRMNASANG